MARRNPRWLRLMLFALANLICWAGFAAAVGLIVSPNLNLGLETSLRAGQATVAALWERIGQAPTAAAGPGQGLPATPPAAIVAGDQPIAAVVTPGGAVAVSTPQPYTTAAAVATEEADRAPTPEPEATLVSHPLLLADPAFSNTALLDAEMACSSPDRAVQIRYREDALNAEIAALWQNNPNLPYRNVWVDLRRDRVVVTGKTTILDHEVYAEITGWITAADCVPVLEIERLTVGGVMIPDVVWDDVESRVMEAMTWYPADYPLCVEEIVVEETHVTVYGHRR